MDHVVSLHYVGKHVSKLQLFGTGCTAIGCFAAVLVTALAYDMALNNYIVIATSGTFSYELMHFYRMAYGVEHSPHHHLPTCTISSEFEFDNLSFHLDLQRLGPLSLIFYAHLLLYGIPRIRL